MDNIQKFLVTAGRKDLAQEYYEKIAGKIPGLPNKKELEKTFPGTEFNLLNNEIFDLSDDQIEKFVKIPEINKFFENKKYKIDEWRDELYMNFLIIPPNENKNYPGKLQLEDSYGDAHLSYIWNESKNNWEKVKSSR